MRSSRFERSGGTGRELPIGASLLQRGTLLHGRTRAFDGSGGCRRIRHDALQLLFAGGRGWLQIDLFRGGIAGNLACDTLARAPCLQRSAAVEREVVELHDHQRACLVAIPAKMGGGAMRELRARASRAPRAADALVVALRHEVTVHVVPRAVDHPCAICGWARARGASECAGRGCGAKYPTCARALRGLEGGGIRCTESSCRTNAPSGA